MHMNISLPLNLLTPDGDIDPDFPQPATTRLYGQINVNGYPFHIWAIEVLGEDEDHCATAVNPVLQYHLDSLNDISGATSKAMPYNGRWYVLVIYPFAH